MPGDINKLAQYKLMILFFLNKMDMPLSSSQITEFAVELDLMDYFTLQKCIGDLVEIKYIQSSTENTVVRYSITDEGTSVLSHLANILPDSVISEILKYVTDERGDVRRSFDVAANYFLVKENEYLVKCGVYEDFGNVLMELNVTVATKAHAKQICKNWRSNTSGLYGSIVKELSKKEKNANSNANIVEEHKNTDDKKKKPNRNDVKKGAGDI